MMHALRKERREETAAITEVVERMKAIAENREVGPAYNSNSQRLIRSTESSAHDRTINNSFDTKIDF
jgi:DNA-binding protein H-NS